MSHQSLPPKWACRVLRVICPADLYEEIEGDLIQRYERDINELDVSEAKRRFVWSVIRFCRPGIVLRNRLTIKLTNSLMLKNYFKVALRVMLRNKAYSSINIFGLALGISGALLLFLWIEKEFTYEQFHSDKERIYKVWNRSSENNGIQCWDVTPRILAPTLQDEFASVETAVSYASWGEQQLFSVGDKRLLKETGAYTDQAFLTLFTFPLLKGNPSKALKNPNSIVLTEHFAHELFGEKEALGETLTIGESGYTFPLTVTGILKDLPSNTDFHFEYLISFQFLEDINGGREVNWGNNSVSSFVKLKQGADITTVNNEIREVVKKHNKDASHLEVFLYPLTKMRLYARFENGQPHGGRIEIIRMLGMLGLCLIAIACINFINLCTARAQRRSKEVAIRKVAGAHKYSLVLQFLCESVVTAFAAGLISLLAVYFALPYFNTLVGQQLTLDFKSIYWWLAGFSFVVIIGLLAGSYPALYLSSFKPVRILKGISLSASGKSRLREVLVVAQFGFAVTLIISAIVIKRQIEFVQNREAGYNKDHLVYQFMTGDLGKNYLAYRNELIQSRLAEAVTKTSTPITERRSNTTEIGWNGKDSQNKILFERFYMDENISATAGITIVKGRDMDLQQFTSDSTAVLLNEAAAAAMGFKQPLGEIITDNGQHWHVVGVIKDFILTSPYQKVEPLILFGCHSGWVFNVIHMRLNPAKTVQESLTALAGLSRKYNPDYPFEYHFADVEYQRKFANLETTQSITTLFSSIAILIAGLGLLGSATHMIEVRVKEIGIRKVMGGSVASITKLLSWNSLKPILIAIALFSPWGWISMNWWLSSFAYRISMNVWTVLFAAAIIIIIALMVISVQTIRAARTNPADSLRNE